ncbi:calpain family cysteine peptidase [Tenggerimyces flavus]|uniref:Calpain catalytic domain-containing protein n=1 Tax=Tenggerimyces flavus TaxID=1708749 RepID=A0ABV7YGM2_9ACTN|nr:hypothetical protein [Tenggerimyces flavus]MBM7783334.1 hypothetical protein [Tenggerimyces flavus]
MSELRGQVDKSETPAEGEPARSESAEFGRLEALAELRSGDRKAYDPSEQVGPGRVERPQPEVVQPIRPELAALSGRVADQAARRFGGKDDVAGNPAGGAPDAGAPGKDGPREVREVREPPLTQRYFQALPEATYERYLVRDQDKPIPAFDGEPTRKDVAQGRIGDCGVLATFGAVAGHRPGDIERAIKQVGEGEYEVTVHEIKPASHLDPVARPTGNTRTIRLSDELPVREDHPARDLVGAKAEVVAWPALLEKAIAAQDQTWDASQKARWDHTWRTDRKGDIDAQRAKQNIDPTPDDGPTGYDRLQAGSTPRDRADLLATLTGQEAEVRKLPSDNHTLLTELRTKLEEGKPILVNTRSPLEHEPAPFSPSVFAFRHVYEVTSVDGDKIRLRNPWGEGHDPPAMEARTFLELVQRYNPDGTRNGSYTTLR